ncbi:hypothetical protein A3J36_02845 [Candidatus Uhrbacteria bacterium RIFCSPLOWO2_02_FULL_54_37]|uniref:Radical SAM core domain-containing protein n=1 Tax=Candidatus Uhrbacteria bacterium RIFCSPLOWO2_02_FULL_54_37 TaxID=1802412 RepID=A0A1F7VHF3_9BACT|nr:MAG: hypothetical protein A3J36_02845 [Candidatus Uhrbacteria bacterium RIFCSPLOWO2_02_FULL_54_37]
MSTLRKEQFKALFPDEPKFRWNQIETARFNPSLEGWRGATTLPKAMQMKLMECVPWMAVREVGVFKSSRGDTYKAVLATREGQRFETVLMENRRGQWTICVSSQIGCAMRCSFCATGTMGLTRSLTADEIVDQYRYWQQYLHAHPALPPRISNVVFMGMGEPLANYEQVKGAIRTWQQYIDLGKTKITVSTVGLVVPLEKILTDPEWPEVRLAVSLHSADPRTRQEIVPTSVPDFLPKLADWARRYALKYGNRRHHLTFEYVMLSGINDTPAHAKALGEFSAALGRVKVNVIPYNRVPGKPFSPSAQESLEQFKSLVRRSGVDVTQRRTMGDDIAAACGQLVIEGAR